MGAGAGPQRAEAPGDALGELKSLLFGLEARRIEGVEAELRALAASRLPRDELRSATALILADALREAEVDRHRELADAIAPLIVAAIRAEIRNSRESMVEALYPLMGRLVSASVANAFRELSNDLAERIDGLISTRRWRWRIKSWVTGRPVSEIALAEARRGRVVQVIALERGSGAPIAVWPADGDEDGRSGLVSGLIAAITEFAAETFAREGGTLRALDLGARRVLLRSSATLVVAAECEGELQAADEAAIDDAFLALLRRHERARELTSADLSTMDAALAPATPKPSRAAAWLVRGLAMAAVLGLAFWFYGALSQWRLERRVAAGFAEARAAAPDTLAYPLSVEIDHRAARVALRGLSASEAQVDRLIAALKPVAAPYQVQAQVETIATGASLARANDEWESKVRALAEEASAFRAQMDERLAALEASGRVASQTLGGDLNAARALAESQRREIAAMREAAARQEERAQSLAKGLAELRARADAPIERLRREMETSAVFYGKAASEFVDPAAAAATADRLAALIKETGARIRVVGHTDDTGSSAINLELSRSRAEAFVRLLTERGVPPHLLTIASRRAVYPISDVVSSAGSSNRRVTFEFPYKDEPG
jgi:outer membrane protein OmpA-like peptidoglycan-associated protein